MKKEITSRQFAILTAISMLTFKLTYLPSFLFGFAGKEGFWSFLILLIADLISFAFIMPVFIKHRDETFSDFLEKRVGKVISKIIYLLIFAFYLLKIMYLTNIGYYFAREAIFQNASFALFVFILFVTINALYLFKLNSYARTSEFCYLIMIIFFFFCVFLGVLTIPNHGFLPFFERGAGDIFYASWKTVFCIGDYLFILPLMGKVHIDNKFGKKLALYMSISFALLIGFFLTFYVAFRYTGFIHQPAITDIIEFVPLSSIIENLDLLPITLMLSLYIFHGGLFMFCMMICLKNIFKFKKRRVDHRWLLLLVNAIIIPLLLLVFDSYDTMIFLAQNYFIWLALVCIFVVPLICLIISFKKVEKMPERKQWAIKINNEDLKWTSATKEIKNQLALTKKIKFGGQRA